MPPQCSACRALVLSHNALCPQCWKSLEFISKPLCPRCGRALPFFVEHYPDCFKCVNQPPAYDLARGLFKFDEHSKRLIHNFKYYDKTSLATTFAQMLYNTYKLEIADFEVIIPVPMHRFKRMIRFYNHSFILGAALGKIADKPVYANVLLKTRWTAAQATLNKKQRQLNLDNSFSLANIELIKNKKVILIDDVSTTGATAAAICKELKKHAKEVFLLCVALT